MQHLECYEEAANRSKLLAFGMGFRPRLGDSSLIRMLGRVRGDKDDATVHDLMAIAAHVFQPAYRARTEVASKRINLIVLGYDHSFVHFQISITTQTETFTQLGKLMEAYCARQSLNRGDLRFLFDGQTLRDVQTASELEMEDDEPLSSSSSFSLLLLRGQDIPKKR
jgi:small ubiquitin-related modifier